MKNSSFYKSSEFAFFILIQVAVVIAFYSLLGAPRLTWDDDVNIFANPLFQSNQWLPFWRESYYGLYVPITSTIWSALFHLGGGSALPFRILNLVLHLSIVTIVFLMLRSLAKRWQLDRWVVLVGTAIFALHPLQVHAVAWISGGRDLLAALFGLIAVGIYFSKPARKFFSLATMFFLLAILSKPSIVILPFAILALEWIFDGKLKVWSLVKMGLWSAFGVCSILITRSAQQEFIEQHQNLLQRALVVFDTYSFYLQKLVFPYPLSANYGRTPQAALADPGLIWSVLLAAAAVTGFLLLTFRRDRRYALALVWAIGLLPVSGIVNFAFQMISTPSDHYNYLPMAAVSAWLVFFLSRRRVLGLPKWSLNGVLVLLIAGLTFMSWERAQAWMSNEAFFTDMIRTAPNSYSTAIGMSVVTCEQHQDFEAGVRWTEIALIAKPNDIIALANQAYCYLNAKNYFRVMELEFYLDRLDLKEMEAKHPTPYSSLLASIGTAYIEQQQFEEGFQFLCEAYRVHPAEPQHTRNLQIAERILRERGIDPVCGQPPSGNGDEYDDSDEIDTEPIVPVWPEEGE